MNHEPTLIHAIGGYLATHTPQLARAEIREALIKNPGSLLVMGFAFGLMFQEQMPATAAGVLATIPDYIRQPDDAINGLNNAIIAFQVEQRRRAQRKDQP